MNIQHTVVHIVKSTNMNLLHDELNEFYISLIQCRLSGSSLTKKDKIAVIDKIIENKKQETKYE